MSQATPSICDEQAMSHGSVSNRSSGSRIKPPRYPSFTFRRAASKTPDRLKDEVPQATRTRSAPTMSESDGPLDGKLFHVRVTLGYLKAIQKTEKHKTSSQKGASSLVTAFASLDNQAVSSEYHYAPSMPLNMTSDVTNVVWPKQKHDESGIAKSNRRLYFCTTLQSDDDEVELRHVLSNEDDVSTVTGTSGWNHEEETESFAPKLIKIQLGVARGQVLLPLGVATLVLDGRDVSGKQIDLPVRALLPGEDDSTSKGESPKRRGLKRLFGKKSKSALQNSFAGDDYEYSFTPNALLRVRVDVISDASPWARTSVSGPAVWGDGIDDDNDSFASIVVMDMSAKETPEEGSNAGSQREGESTLQPNTEAAECIEIVNNPAGPSIISTPPKYVEPDVLDIDTHHSSMILPVKSIDVEEQDTFLPTTSQVTPSPSPSPSILQTTGMLCGFTEAFSPPGIEADLSTINFEDSSTIATSLYKGTRGEAWKHAARKQSPNTAQSTASSGIIKGSRSLGTVDERTEGTASRASVSRATRASRSRASRSRASASRSDFMDSRDFDETISIGDDTLRSLDEAKKALQLYAKRTGENYQDMLEHLDVASSSDLLSLEQSIGDDTIESVIEAKELLQSYARRVGLGVEDLLKVDVINWDSFVSPLSSRSLDETEGTNTTKSSKSRFSLFVDD